MALAVEATRKRLEAVSKYIQYDDCHICMYLHLATHGSPVDVVTLRIRSELIVLLIAEVT